MKRVIRKRGACVYLGSNGARTPDLSFAVLFEDVHSALSYWETNCDADAEYLVIMGDRPSEEDDLSLPLLPSKVTARKESCKVPDFISVGFAKKAEFPTDNTPKPRGR